MRSSTNNHNRERLVVQTYVIHDVSRVIVSAWFRRHRSTAGASSGAMLQGAAPVQNGSREYASGV